LNRATIVLSATSTGSCIDQSWLKPGSIVIDVGVPTDVRGGHAMRDDAMFLTGGLIRVPPDMSLDSRLLWFQRGMIPSCFGETLLLALEDRAECLSLGRDLQPETVQEIGAIARSHGFDFTRLCSFGSPLADETLVKFHKARARLKSQHERNGKPKTIVAPTP